MAGPAPKRRRRIEQAPLNTLATPMAKKRPHPRRKPPKHAGPTRPLPEFPAPLPDRRALERTMKDLTRQLSGEGRVETPLDRAQDVMYEAFGQRDPELRMKLAKKALEISPDCADAYVLLAEHARSRKEALDSTINYALDESLVRHPGEVRASNQQGSHAVNGRPYRLCCRIDIHLPKTSPFYAGANRVPQKAESGVGLVRARRA